jgi:alpha-L-fucosidase 2
LGAQQERILHLFHLQAVWTADNGRLPPWKGDFHHDLNTQLSYWPGYIANHSDLTAGFTNWLWNVRSQNSRWTKSYFGTEGLNVPGVTTISGKEMGGWIQYSMSPTTVAWLAQHFYWQYKFGSDDSFLKNRCLPYFREAEKYFSGILKMNDQGYLTLPLSSSPEIHDNSMKAWFKEYTNYDLALIKWFYTTYWVLLNNTLDPEISRIEMVLASLPEFSINETGLMVAPSENLDDSHRHLSNYMAIFPLELVSMEMISKKRLFVNQSSISKNLEQKPGLDIHSAGWPVFMPKQEKLKKLQICLENLPQTLLQPTVFT